MSGKRVESLTRPDFAFCAKPPESARGFTLIEMLVVIGIMCLLMGILLPAVKTARETGRIAKCNSNLRQIGFAVNLYCGDSGRYATGTSMPGNKLWFEVLSDRYLYKPTTANAKKEVFFCPSHMGAAFSSSAISYGHNYEELPGDPNYVKLSTIQAQAVRILIADSRGRMNAEQDRSSLIRTKFIPVQTVGPGADQCYIYGRHRKITDAPSSITDEGHANVLFLDGHTELRVALLDYKPDNARQNINCGDREALPGLPADDAGDIHWRVISVNP